MEQQVDLKIDALRIKELLGETDIYLLDQIFKGRFQPEMKLLDAGCGQGRNMSWFLNQGYDIVGIDRHPGRISEAGKLLEHDCFKIEAVENMSFENESFDGVISCAVLHFASGESHFQTMMDEMWRVLKPGGILFARLATSIGIEPFIKQSLDKWYYLPDGTERFLVDYDFLKEEEKRLAAKALEPLKTVNVENKRAMTTWVLQK